MMVHRTGLSTFSPRPMLRPYVQAYYRIDGSDAASAAVVGGPGLSVDLWWVDGDAVRAASAGGRATTCGDSVAVGVLTRMVSVKKGRGTRGFGVSLAPMMASALFGVSAGELADQFSDIGAVLERRAPGLSDKIRAANTPLEKARVIEQELLKVACRMGGADDRVGRVIARIMLSLRGASVENLAAEIGYTRRSLVNLVRESLGISPKELIRIMRFRKALKLMERWSEPDWLTVVAECGYVDQSHFIRHCKDFTGLAPRQFLERSLFPPLEHQVPEPELVS